MKKLTIALFAAAILSACGEASPPATKTSPTPQAMPAPPVQSAPLISGAEWKERLAKALAAVRKEKQVRDASWLNEQPASLLAGVIDDGSRRDGYAAYLCSVLADNGLHGGVVRVMDGAAAARSEWRELGRADCPTSAEVTWVDFTTR